MLWFFIIALYQTTIYINNPSKQLYINLFQGKIFYNFISVVSNKDTSVPEN